MKISQKEKKENNISIQSLRSKLHSSRLHTRRKGIHETMLTRSASVLPDLRALFEKTQSPETEELGKTNGDRLTHIEAGTALWVIEKNEKGLMALLDGFESSNEEESILAAHLMPLLGAECETKLRQIVAQEPQRHKLALALSIVQDDPPLQRTNSTSKVSRVYEFQSENPEPVKKTKLLGR